MNETPDQIESHIRHTREDLSANLNELEQKVKAVTDWRHHYAKSPGTFLATALGGGLLLALATSRHRSRGVSAPLSPSNPVPGRPQERGPLDDSLSAIKVALIGLAAAQAKSVLSKLLPGFEAQWSAHDKPKRTRPADPATQAEARNGASNSG
jgi:hypothetical protein